MSPKKLTALLLPLVIALSGCTSDQETIAPQKVINNAPESKFGKQIEVQRVLRKASELTRAAYKDLKTLNISSDYFNVRDAEITFSETWASAWGVGLLHLVTMAPSPNRMVFATKDDQSICWYIEITPKDDDFNIRYGASADQACRARTVDEVPVAWSEGSFPLNPNGATTPATATPAPDTTD